MEQIVNVLKFLKLVDSHDGQLSITSIALAMVLVKLWMAPAPGFAELGALLGTLLLYAHKRSLAYDRATDTEAALAVEDTTADLADRLTHLETEHAKVEAKVTTVDNRTKPFASR